MLLIDWFYKPEIAAMVTEAINYITAVPSVQQIVKADAARRPGRTRAADRGRDQLARLPTAPTTQAEVLRALTGGPRRRFTRS